MKVMRMAVWGLILITAFLMAESAHAFYNPQTGRWLSRDPIGETGGPNLNGFLANNAANRIV